MAVIWNTVGEGVVDAGTLISTRYLDKHLNHQDKKLMDKMLVNGINVDECFMVSMDVVD